MFKLRSWGFALLVGIGILAVPAGASALQFGYVPGGPITAGTSPNLVNFNQIDTADFNGDAFTDIAATSDATGNYVWLSDGDGTFTPAAASFRTDIASEWIKAGFFDDDENFDLLIGDQNFPSTMRTYLGNGDGTFGAQAASFNFSSGWSPVSTSGSVAIGDVNGDDIPDAVASINNRQYAVALGEGDGSFTPLAGNPFTFPVLNPGGQFESIALGHYDDDDELDLALATRDFGPASGVYVADGNGDGSFTPLSNTPLLATEGSAIEGISTARLDADADDDLAVTLRSSTDDVRTMLGGPTSLVPNPSPAGSTDILPDFVQGVAVADFDQANYDDIASGAPNALGVAVTDDDAGIAPALGGPSFLGWTQGHPNPRLLRTGDFNDDGAPDMAVLSGHSGAGQEDQSRAIFPLLNLPDLTGPQLVEFPEAELGSEPISETVTIVNAGPLTAQMVPDGVGITGEDADLFTVTPADPDCFVAIPPGGECEFEVEFDPARIDEKSASLRLEWTGASDPSLEIPFIANVTPAPANPEITLTPAAHDFGPAEIGATGNRPSFTFNVNSVGNAPAVIDAVSAVATDAFPRSFAITEDGCDGPVEPGSSCPITVTFNPVDGDPGQRQGELVVDTTFESAEATLAGTAVQTLLPPPPPPPPPPAGVAELRLRLKAPKKVKRGKKLILTARITNVGETTASGVSVKARVPKKLAKQPKQARIPSLAAGSTVTRKLKVKVKRGAKKGKKLKVKVIASSPGLVTVKAAKAVRVR